MTKIADTGSKVKNSRWEVSTRVEKRHIADTRSNDTNSASGHTQSSQANDHDWPDLNVIHNTLCMVCNTCPKIPLMKVKLSFVQNSANDGQDDRITLRIHIMKFMTDR